MEAQQVVSSPLRFCTEVPVACIPANYRKRLPRQARLCYVEEPVWDEASDAYFTRIGGTPQSLTHSRLLRLSVEEAETIFQTLDTPTSDEPPVQALPSYLLPDALRDLDGSRSCDLNGELAQAMRSHALTLLPAKTDVDGSVALPTDVPEGASLPCRLYDYWFVAATTMTDNEGRCLVSVAPLAHRLSGRSSGTVYTAWLDATILEQAMPVNESFDCLDCHESRLQVNGFAIAHGAVPPPEEPEPVRRAEAAFTTTALEEQYQLVPLKDPIYLRKEDVIALPDTNAAALPVMLDTQRMLSKAIAAVQRDQTSLAQQRRDGEVERLDVLLRCLEETLDWYKRLPRHQRGERILSVSVLGSSENQDRFPRQQGARQPRCIQLVVGIPTTLPLPWSQMADVFCWPQGTGARSGPPAAGVGARIVA